MRLFKNSFCKLNWIFNFGFPRLRFSSDFVSQMSSFGFRISFFLLFISSCTTTNSPRPIAEKFLDAYQHHDFEAAKKYSTKETVKLLQVLERISKEETEQTTEPVKIEITSEEIAGEKATVYFKETGDSTEQKLMLKKVVVNGAKEKQWRVLLTKEDAKIGR